MKQISIFENHSHDNFEEIDSQIENFEGVWDGKFFSFSNYFEYRFN